MANRKLFVNLAVKDLPRSRAFFDALGFTFNEQFSNEQAASMVLGPDNYVMLLTEPFFATFIKKKKQCDTSTTTEAILCISAESRAEVDDLVNKALKAGATKAEDPQDHGFMFLERGPRRRLAAPQGAHPRAAQRLNYRKPTGRDPSILDKLDA